MKILWIEDFPEELDAPKIVIEMFSGMIAETIFDEEYDEHKDVAEELNRLFEKHTLHQIEICKSYLGWKEVYKADEFDFDVVIIDINLVSYHTPEAEKPELYRDNADFDKKAGLYIYNQLIKDAFPDSNIAFFTGNKGSIEGFVENRKNEYNDIPQNTFEKVQTDYELLRKWLKEKEIKPYLTLRRGIIEGCRVMKAELDNITPADLEDRLLFYKTTSVNIEYQPDIYKAEVKEYLNQLETFFTLSQRNTQDHDFFSFLTVLTKKWDNNSLGDFNRHKALPDFKTEIEDKFSRTCQMQMKLLRNCAAHELLPQHISEKEVAFFFIIAMRSWIQFKLTELLKYEQILATLFTPLSIQEMNQIINIKLEEHLDKTYYHLKSNYEELKKYLDKIVDVAKREKRPGWEKLEKRFTIERAENYFFAMFKIYVEGPKYLEPNLADIFKRRLRELAVLLFYQSYWHGLFPAWIKPAKYDDLQSVGFHMESIMPESFIFFIGRLIFAEAFQMIK